MEEKCFCHFNGYEVKDAAARKIAVTPQMFGAVGDGITDDSTAIQAAINSGTAVVFPAGKYKFSGITCSKSVTIEFNNAELVLDYLEGTNGVFKNVFKFTDCDTVTIKGLMVKNNPIVAERTYTYLTKSICEFHNCKNVNLKNWDVYGITMHNMGNTPEELYNRRGVLFTGIDSNIHVCNCDFGGIEYEEWFWVTYQNNLNQSSCIVERCRFYDSKNGKSCTGIIAHTAKVIDCVFENITHTESYRGTMANVMSLYGEFSDNVILNCTVGGVCDFRESGWVFSNYAKIHNNRMVNSRCNKFAAVSGKDVHITSNIVTARTFSNSINPLENNILREEGEVKKIRYVIENNVAEALGTEIADGQIVDSGIDAEKSFLFFRFSNWAEGIWKSSDSEILLRNNRFFSNKPGIKNALLCAIDAGKIVLHENILYMGNRSAATETGYTTLQLSKVNVDGPVVDLVKNNIVMNTVNAGEDMPCVVHIASAYTDVKMNAFFNSASNFEVLPRFTSETNSGVLKIDAQANINFNEVV